MMDNLGLNYIDTGHYPEGITVFRDLMARDRGAHVCEYQAHVTDATMAMKSGNKDAIKSELETQLRVAAAFKASSNDQASKQVCANRTAALVTETAMAWHLEAVGTPGQRGTGDAKTMTASAALYQRVVNSWSKQEMASFQFPRLVKEDWPTLFTIKYAMADLLYFQKDWARCGPAFDGVVTEDPSGPDAAQASYAAGLCYQNVYEEKHQGDLGRRSAGNLPGRAGDQAACERCGGPRAAHRGQVRARPHVLRGPALGGSGSRVPRDRAPVSRPRGRDLRVAAVPRERERPP